jgi:hypothetical protein
VKVRGGGNGEGALFSQRAKIFFLNQGLMPQRSV